MKKNFLRIFATASVVVALLFVIVLLIAVYGGIGQADFESGLVQGLFTALGVIYLLLAAATVTMLFMNDEAAKEIVLRSDTDGTTRTTVGVVKRIAKETIALVSGVKCTRCAIVSNDYGVRLKVTVKVKDIDVGDAERYVRACLEDAFLGKLNFKFYSIEIKVNKLKSKYAVDVEKVKKLSDEQVAEKQPVPTPVIANESAPLPTEEIAVEEPKAEVLATVEPEETLSDDISTAVEEAATAGEETTGEEPASYSEPLDPTTLDSPIE
ncbi:MAG: hypothetical protein IJ735_02755 [Clostridia bacterium]|nr:hypothetical protein [Clostridia bacterium]